MRDRTFYINSIKMDLHRVVTAAGDIRKDLALESVNKFMKHAIDDFQKFDKSARDKKLLRELRTLHSKLRTFADDPLTRLRWAEDVMTVRCRL